MNWKSLLDGGASEAQKKNEINAAWLKQQFGGAASLGEGLLMQALAGIDKGYESAKANISKQGEVATTNILAQGEQALAKGQQALIDSGLSGTAAAGLPGKVAYQTQQALAGLGSQLGAQQAQLDVGQAQSNLAGSQNIANWALNKVNTASGITPQYSSSGPGLLEIAGKVAGSYVSGGLSL